MNVDFSSCLVYIRKLNSLQQDQFFLVTQAFASPPDMASSGVWENVILPKTPTFEGVSGILYYIIFLNLLPNFLILLTDIKPNVVMLTDLSQRD